MAINSNRNAAPPYTPAPLTPIKPNYAGPLTTPPQFAAPGQVTPDNGMGQRIADLIMSKEGLQVGGSLLGAGMQTYAAGKSADADREANAQENQANRQANLYSDQMNDTRARQVAA